ncbi:MAG: sugar nucleotide-binding protein [Eubacterium sp.]|nr:sugar nucleotide-binding protein [Eubacterium sp.]
MYLVVGANGFLGSYVLKNILEQTNDFVIAVARKTEQVTASPRIRWVSCDITDTEGVDVLCRELECYDDMKVVFLVAYHNPDMVEKNLEIAWNINVTSLSYFVNNLRNVKCLFYASTDNVYGNSIDNYRFKENDLLNPVNVYGRQKCAAESIVIWYGYNVVRYPFLISPSLSPVKRHFYDVITDTMKNGREIEMFADSFRSSLSFDTGAALLIDLIEGYSGDVPKVLNICGDDAFSKYEIGLMLAKKLGVDNRLVVPVLTAEAQGIFEAERAKSTLMDNTKVKEVLGIDEIKLVL